MVSVRYFVSNVDASREFYCILLGFELVEQYGPAIAILRKGDLTLWLSGPGTSAMKPMKDGRVPEPGGWNRFVVEVEDMEETMASLLAQGATFRNDPLSGPGGTQVLLDDPDGNPVELFQARA
ncbi:MAG: VOC family protein [Armatimonadetes bacterium]|nr:VOC family protein [Armatimonadota bacterium]